MTRTTKLAFIKRKDKVSRRITDLTAKEFVDWLIKYHGLPAGARQTVTMNLNEQFQWHQLRGRTEANKPLADALDAFGNTAFGVVINSEQRTDLSVISAMSQGFAAIAAELRKGAES